jgi:hypothetical protein
LAAGAVLVDPGAIALDAAAILTTGLHAFELTAAIDRGGVGQRGRTTRHTGAAAVRARASHIHAPRIHAPLPRAPRTGGAACAGQGSIANGSSTGVGFRGIWAGATSNHCCSEGASKQDDAE